VADFIAAGIREIIKMNIAIDNRGNFTLKSFNTLGFSIKAPMNMDANIGTVASAKYAGASGIILRIGSLIIPIKIIKKIPVRQSLKE
jgi:hypothetical protein